MISTQYYTVYEHNVHMLGLVSQLLDATAGNLRQEEE
jgi:hypothetical protein